LRLRVRLLSGPDMDKMGHNHVFMGYDFVLWDMCVSLAYAIRSWTIFCRALVRLSPKMGGGR